MSKNVNLCHSWVLASPDLEWMGSNPFSVLDRVAESDSTFSIGRASCQGKRVVLRLAGRRWQGRDSSVKDATSFRFRIVLYNVLAQYYAKPGMCISSLEPGLHNFLIQICLICPADISLIPRLSILSAKTEKERFLNCWQSWMLIYFVCKRWTIFDAKYAAHSLLCLYIQVHVTVYA